MTIRAAILALGICVSAVGGLAAADAQPYHHDGYHNRGYNRGFHGRGYGHGYHHGYGHGYRHRPMDHRGWHHR